jgi:hypothetical protein
MLAISDSIRAIEASIALLLHYLLQKSCRVQGMRFILIPIHSETLSGDLKRPAVPAGSSSYVSQRIIGKETIKLVEFDPENRILSTNAFKVNVVYLNQK